MTQLGIQKLPKKESSAKDEEKFNLLDRFLGKCGLFWNRLPITPELIEAWFEEIQPFTVKAIERSMREYLQEEAYFPVPGTLIPRIKGRVGYREVDNG